jgi:two-component sensor histidine kinase
MTWVETGGPHVDEPVTHGFGSTVIEKMVSSNLRCTPELYFCATGVVWQIDCATEILLTER